MNSTKIKCEYCGYEMIIYDNMRVVCEGCKRTIPLDEWGYIYKVTPKNEYPKTYSYCCGIENIIE